MLGQALLELEVNQHLGAESCARTGQHNGSRERQRDMRAGTPVYDHDGNHTRSYTSRDSNLHRAAGHPLEWGLSIRRRREYADPK